MLLALKSTFSCSFEVRVIPFPFVVIGDPSVAIPKYDELMLPLLDSLKDGQEHTSRTLIERLSQQFLLTDAERRQLLPSGQQSDFDNRQG